MNVSMYVCTYPERVTTPTLGTSFKTCILVAFIHAPFNTRFNAAVTPSSRKVKVTIIRIVRKATKVILLIHVPVFRGDFRKNRKREDQKVADPQHRRTLEREQHDNILKETTDVNGTKQLSIAEAKLLGEVQNDQNTLMPIKILCDLFCLLLLRRKRSCLLLGR